jgi:hypothetical protein
MTERLELGEREGSQGRIGHLNGIQLATCLPICRELLVKQVRPFSRFVGVRGELSGRQFLHELVQNDTAQATAFDRHRCVERRVFGGIRRLRRQGIRIAFAGFGPYDRWKALLDPAAGKPANTPETRERYISGLCAFLNLQIAAGQYPNLPAFKRDQKARNPARRARRDVENVDKRLLGYLFRACHSTIAAQLHIEYVGGTRVSSVLHGCSLGDLDLRAMKLVIRETKNGEDVPIALPSDIKPVLETYLHWRQQQVRAGRVGPGSNQPLFLTYKGRPYKFNGGAWGTQNKTGFNAAKRRAIKDISKDYDEAIAATTAAGDVREADKLRRSKDDDITLMRRFTQHWLRHLFATDAGRKDLRAAMAQGGWLDARSVTGYLISDAEYQRDVVEQRGSPASVRKAG